MKNKSIFVIENSGYNPRTGKRQKTPFVKKLSRSDWSFNSKTNTWWAYDAGAGPGPCGSSIHIEKDKVFSTLKEAFIALRKKIRT